MLTPFNLAFVLACWSKDERDFGLPQRLGPIGQPVVVRDSDWRRILATIMSSRLDGGRHVRPNSARSWPWLGLLQLFLQRLSGSKGETCGLHLVQLLQQLLSLTFRLGPGQAFQARSLSRDLQQQLLIRYLLSESSLRLVANLTKPVEVLLLSFIEDSMAINLLDLLLKIT